MAGNYEVKDWAEYGPVITGTFHRFEGEPHLGLGDPQVLEAISSALDNVDTAKVVPSPKPAAEPFEPY